MIEFEKEKIRKSVPKILEALKKKRFDAHFFEFHNCSSIFLIASLVINTFS